MNVLGHIEKLREEMGIASVNSHEAASAYLQLEAIKKDLTEFRDFLVKRVETLDGQTEPTTVSARSAYKNALVWFDAEWEQE